MKTALLCALRTGFLWVSVLGMVSVVWTAAARADDNAMHGRALIIGVNNYDDANINDLHYSVADAHLLADRLDDKQSGLFAPDNVRVLADDTDTKPTRAAILKGIEWLSEAAPDETVLLYFSGHGTIDKKEQYLAPADTELAAIPDSAVAVSRVNSILDDPQRTKARRVVVIFDSCHSGVRRGARDLESGVSEGGAVGESLMTDAEGRVTLASCNADEQSFEDPDKAHGVFTYFLAEGLKGAADTNNDGLVSVGELHVYTRKAVTEWAIHSGHLQTPRVQMNVSGEILLARDPAKLSAAQTQQKQRLTRLQQLRTDLQTRIGTDNLAPATAAPLLAALDRLLAGRGASSDIHREAIATQYVAGKMATATINAELQTLDTPDDAACGNDETEDFGVNGPGDGAGSGDIKVQLFQPQAQEVEDGFTIACHAGDEVKVVGLAQATAGVTRVLLNCRELAAGSLDARDLEIVKAAAPAAMKFQGAVRAGDAPSTVILTIYDAMGNRRTLRLRLQPAAPLPVAVPLKPVVAIIGLNKKAEINTYDDLRPLRVGMGMTEQLINVARDSGRCTLVNGDSEVLKSLIEMQWQQQDASFDRSRAVRTGRLFGARFVLYGVIYYFALPSENDGDLTLKIQLKMVDVETGLLYPASGEAALPNPTKQAGGREFSKKDLDQVTNTAMQQALNDLWSYLGKQGVLPLPQLPLPIARVPQPQDPMNLAPSRNPRLALLEKTL